MGVMLGGYSSLRRLKYPATKEYSPYDYCDSGPGGRRPGKALRPHLGATRLFVPHSAGRVAALVGPNGAGKTTLLHMAVGLLTPTAGSVRVFGAPPESVRQRVGFVAQDHPLYRSFTVGETLTMGRKLNRRWDDTVAKARLRQLGVRSTARWASSPEASRRNWR